MHQFTVTLKEQTAASTAPVQKLAILDKTITQFNSEIENDFKAQKMCNEENQTKSSDSDHESGK